MRVLNISYLSECITFEISISNKDCCFIYLYRSPSQTQDKFQTFKSKSQSTISTYSYAAIHYLLSWFVILMTNLKTDAQMIQLVSKVQNLIFSHLSLDSHCNKRTYIFENSKSYIDLIFTFQPYMVIHSGVQLLYTWIATTKLYTQSSI